MTAPRMSKTRRLGVIASIASFCVAAVCAVAYRSDAGVARELEWTAPVTMSDGWAPLGWVAPVGRLRAWGWRMWGTYDTILGRGEYSLACSWPGDQPVTVSGLVRATDESKVLVWRKPHANCKYREVEP